jgi:hypothetical protein
LGAFFVLTLHLQDGLGYSPVNGAHRVARDCRHRGG